MENSKDIAKVFLKGLIHMPNRSKCSKSKEDRDFQLSSKKWFKRKRKLGISKFLLKRKKESKKDQISFKIYNLTLILGIQTPKNKNVVSIKI